MNRKRAAFFFGSGISNASFKAFGEKAGTVENITRRLFDEQWQQGADFFLPAMPSAAPMLLDDAQRAQELLRYLKGELDARLLEHEGRRSHYEDIYGAAHQIFQDGAREITNPLIIRTVRELRLATAPLYVRGSATSFRDPFLTLIKNALVLIQSVAWAELGQTESPKEMERLSQFAEVFDEIDIFTLNHDSLVENQLRSNGAPVADGFGDSRPGYRIFNGHWPDGPGIRILKLHGSLDWHYCRFTWGNQYARFRIPVEDCRNDNGTRIDYDRMPYFLSGTHVKEQSYGHSLTGEIFARLRQLSCNHSRIFCCGYGWGDKGVNIRLNQWVCDRPENRLIILHGGKLEDIPNKLFWWRRWQDYYDAKKVRVIENWLPSCTVDAIEREISAN